MLIFNPNRVFALRGVENPAGFLVKHGVIRQTANNLTGQRAAMVKIEHVELICRLLNCHPSDLFEWHPTSAAPLPENHSLNDLKRAATAKSIFDTVKDIPLDEMERLVGEAAAKG